MLGYIFFIFIFLIFYIRYLPKKLHLIFALQLFCLLALLIIGNNLASKFGINYPAIFADGMKYHIIGQIWADNVGFIPRLSDFGVIGEKWPSYISQIGLDAVKNPFSFLAPGWTLLIVGNIYNLFGVNPIFIKLANIFFLQISSLLFFKIIYKPNINWKIFLKIFMYFPIIMIYSVTFLKESWILLLLIICIYSFTFLKSKVFIFIPLFILFLTRPPILFILGMGYLLSLINFKNLKSTFIAMMITMVFLLVLWNLEIGGFGLKYVMNNMYFGLTPRGSEEIRFSGGFHFFQFILSNPLVLIKPVFFGFIDVVMNPNPWNIMYLIDPYTIVGFDYYWEQVGHYLSSINWYIFIFLIFPTIIVLVKDNNLINELKKNKLLVFIYLANMVYMGLRADLRYKFVFMPILIIIGSNLFSTVKIKNNFRLKLIYLSIIFFIFLAIFDTFFWGRTTISIV